ncbi:Flavin-dependent oxidoreductase, luciferase family (includes alkanesulfonate monooxygenase SsuD and methylene tetrahydromethanopterin reductase) [Lentzea xinjiangensis]|uniref:Flavin-dependent oxidoreductase, luciferase family (Includes alkanesulfonate monooxygenase SsuD and methylene tetrahydromethanopterin reductase) n=1 Tax=Lentzea xinjiangensis TaxID=402600 RepID=A0A1H9NCN2_9PSEU|nr:LLM class flavin-dependent oxidoreductase [Lentzea xinjiangensis]SER33704.1 Flavin-dependent oxidoreductase, luciferase family (includes alkanesulfonate monooxygenase SsuD and methylene tetrahydromethanopterin reductase) [Lentzea xinjiangensis]
MTDYGHELSFGVSVDPAAQGLEQAFALARQADGLGLDLLGVQDHAYQPTHLDTWTLLTYLSAATERISVMTDVADLQLRPPAMLAKAASSLAILNGGRVQLGVGGGPFPDAIAGMGAPRREGGAMVAYADISVEILLQALRGGPVRAGNEELDVTYVAGPASRQRPQVWLGAQKTRMLRLVGRRAEGWISPLNIYVPPEDVPEKQGIIDDAARAAGRDPADIRRIYNVIGAITATGGQTRNTAQGLISDVAGWVDFLTSSVTELGFDTFIFWPAGDASTSLEAFAREVAPAVRDRVAEQRASR